MTSDPYQTQEQFDQEVADIEWMDRLDAETPAASTPLSPLGHRAPAAPSPAAASVSNYDARLIRQAREVAALRGEDEKRAWLTANGRPDADGAEYSTVNALIMGTMAYLLDSLAAGYERELAAVKALTSRT